MKISIQPTKSINRARIAHTAVHISDDECAATRQVVVDLDGLGFTESNESDLKHLLDHSGVLLTRGKIYALHKGRLEKNNFLEDIIGSGDPLRRLRRVSNQNSGFSEDIIPRQLVGYVPWERSWRFTECHPDLPSFWGEVYGLQKDSVQRRSRVWFEYLSLPEPPLFQWLDALRAALAAALIQAPSVLILEEPTAAQNSSQKERICALLWALTVRRGLVVLLLTSDLEEAGRADVISEFSHGRVLHRNTAHHFLHFCQSILGEDSGSCQKLRNGINCRDSEPSKKAFSVLDAPDEHFATSAEIPSAPKVDEGMLPSFWHRSLLLFRKRLREDMDLHVYENFIGLMLLYFLLSIVLSAQVSRIPVAVMEPEGNSSIARAFLDSLSEKHILQQAFHHTDNYRANISRNEMFTMMKVGRNSSTAPHYRFRWTLSDTDDYAISAESSLDIEVETNEQDLRFYIQRAVMDSVQSFHQRLLEAYNASSAKLDVEVNDPLFGARLISCPEFVVPRLVVVFNFFVCYLLGMVPLLQIYRDLNEDMRYAMAGVTFLNAIFANSLYMLLLLIAHTTVMLLLMLLFYACDLLPLEGSPSLVICLILTKGLQGMSLGLMVASISLVFSGKSYIHHRFMGSAGLICLPIVGLAPLSLFGGRPNMPSEIIFSISRRLLLPDCTESLRDIIYQGKGLDDAEVSLTLTRSLQLSVIFSLTSALIVKGVLLKWIDGAPVRREKRIYVHQA